ncbi:unnamed protein product [Linum tenue]|nr:unnamed protein product [Linum tenue]
MIEDHYILTRRWKRGFDPGEGDDVLTNLLVWVRLPKLPMDYYDSVILRDVGNSIGKYVKMDETTRAATRGHFARICVEVDLTKPLIVKYRLERRVRRLEYEGLHNVCFGCGRFGHNEDACPKKEKSEPTDDDFRRAQQVGVPKRIEEERPEIFEDFGPWMLASRNRRRTGTKNQTGPREPHRGDTPGKAQPTSSGSRFTLLEDLNDEFTEHTTAQVIVEKEGLDEEGDTDMTKATDEIENRATLTSEGMGNEEVVADRADRGTQAGAGKEPMGKKQVGTGAGQKHVDTTKKQGSSKAKGPEQKEAKKQEKSQQREKGPRHPLPSTPPQSNRAKAASDGSKGVARSLNLNATPGPAITGVLPSPASGKHLAGHEMRRTSETERGRGVAEERQATSLLDVHACNV